ncbi:MAG TPA: hypothetical protein VF556_01915 [Pyrinomonadaceae bacterium]|jgi:hypothetical protein
MIKNNLMRLVFIFAIAVTTSSAFAQEGGENKILPNVESSKISDSAISGNKNPEGSESKISPSAESSKNSDPANSSQQQTTSEPGKNIVYFGGGVSRKGNNFDNLSSSFGDFSENNLAFTFGYLRVSNKSRLIGGADISYEGTMLDGTYGSYSTRGAVSFNGIVGVNVAKNDSVRFDVAGLVGAREKTVDCPSSFLGYACYADEPPSRTFSVNYGGIASFSYKKFVIGARATGASTQGLLGIRF